MTLINKITSSWYDTAFTTSDDANVYENYNYASANTDGVLQCIYRYLQDHERRRNLNCIYGGFQTSLADSDTDLVIGISGTEDAEAMIAGRVVTMASAETMLVENGSLFPADDTYYICLQLSTITETSTRDGSSGETFSWVALTSLSAIDDTYLVVCSVDVSGTQTLFSNLTQLAYPYEVEANKFRPKYDHNMSFYVGDGESQARILSVLMDYNLTTFYLPIKVDTIDEQTGSAGVTVEDMLIKASDKIKVDTNILYTNTIDDFDAGILTITPPTTITGAVITSSTFNSVGDFTVNTTKMVVDATTGDSTIAGTLDVTGLITGIAGFAGALTGNVVGNVTGDVTGNADTATQWETTRTIELTGDVTSTPYNIDGTANVSITTVIGTDNHNHTLSTLDLSGATGITSVGTIGTGVWQGTTIDHLYLTDVNQSLLQASSPTFNVVNADLIGNVTGDVTGNADTATQWETTRNISLTGDVTGTDTINGAGDISIEATVVDDSHSHTNYIQTTATKYLNISIYGQVRLGGWIWYNDDEYIWDSTGSTSYTYCYIYLPMIAGSTQLEVRGYADATVSGTSDYKYDLQYIDLDGSWTTITTQTGSEGTSGGTTIKTLSFTSIISDSGKTYRLRCGIKHSDGGGTATVRVYGARLLYSVD